MTYFNFTQSKKKSTKAGLCCFFLFFLTPKPSQPKSKTHFIVFYFIHLRSYLTGIFNAKNINNKKLHGPLKLLKLISFRNSVIRFCVLHCEVEKSVRFVIAFVKKTCWNLKKTFSYSLLQRMCSILYVTSTVCYFNKIIKKSYIFINLYTQCATTTTHKWINFWMNEKNCVKRRWRRNNSALLW